jgi:GTP-binding protein
MASDVGTPMEVRAAEFVTGAVQPSDLPTDGLPEVAFSGRSNVGKSSLINRLTRRRELARTSATPGKTQQINFYRIDDRFYMVDLPGYGFVRGGVTLRQRLGAITEEYLGHRNTLRAVVQLVDARRGPTDADQDMIQWLRARQLAFLLVFTKADKVSRAQLDGLFARLDRDGALAGADYAPFSAVSGLGCADVLGWIMRALRPAHEQLA